MASWPARWPQGETYDPMVISLDIAATVLDLADAVVTDEERPLDGANLDPYLRGKWTGQPHEALYWRTASPGIDVRVVRRGDMKLVQEGDGRPMLYDLSSQGGERQNLLEGNTETAREMAVLWNAWNEGNTKASLSAGISDYRQSFNEWMETYWEDRRSWVESQERQRMAVSP